MTNPYTVVKKSLRQNKNIQGYEFYQEKAMKWGLPRLNLSDYYSFYKKYHPIVPMNKGTKSPLFGNEAATWITNLNNAPTNAGYTLIENGTLDDGFYTCNFLFGFNMYKQSYTTAYIGTNCYITFGGGSTQYRNFSPSNPPYRKFMIGARDDSCQRAWILSNSDYFRARFEGTRGSTGTGGNPNVVYEVTFCNPSLFDGNNVIELLVGIHASAEDGVFMIANENTELTDNLPTFVQYQSYVFIGNRNGNYWSVYKGYSLTNPPY